MRVGLGLPRGCVPSALLPAIANPGSGEWDWLGDGMERDLLEEVGNCRAEGNLCGEGRRLVSHGGQVEGSCGFYGLEGLQVTLGSFGLHWLEGEHGVRTASGLGAGTWGCRILRSAWGGWP